METEPYVFGYKNLSPISTYLLRRLFIWLVLCSKIHSHSSDAFKCPYMELDLLSNAVDKHDDEKTVKSPKYFMKTLGTSVPQLEHIVDLEVMLEEIAKKSSLYDFPLEDQSGVVSKLIQNESVRNVINECEELHSSYRVSCNETDYRSIDGTCNNLKHFKWGSAFTEQMRLLPPVYEGVSGFRKSVSGGDLPSARNISLKMKSENPPFSSVSALFTFFGQLVSHDIGLTTTFSKNGESYNCCKQFRNNSARCEPIYYPKDDPFYSKLGIPCQNFIRAIPFPKCTFEKRSQLNLINSFLDLSTVYGQWDEVAETVRRFDDTGTLLSRISEFDEILWMNDVENEVFCPYNQTQKCFSAGDTRVNQHTSLMIIHTLYVRLHNTIADNLRQKNTRWDGEKIFQETRRLLIAIHQRIIYGEYLPLLIGSDIMEKYNLNLNFNEGSLFNEDLDPTMTTEFVGAAFRLHSMTPKVFSKNYPQFTFHSSYSATEPVYKGYSDCLIVGSSELPSLKNDRFVIDDISNFLFGIHGATFGLDLMSMNIQRGRDIGLAPYVDILKNISNGQIKIKDFDDLKATMHEDDIQFAKDSYDFPKDIDLFVALLLERVPIGSEVGFTSAKIIAQQFFRMKFGDSFFFTHANGRNPFTSDQMKVIEDFSFARILCLTTKADEIRQYPFSMPMEKKKNPLISCSSFPPLKLDHWKVYEEE